MGGLRAQDADHVLDVRRRRAARSPACRCSPASSARTRSCSRPTNAYGHPVLWVIGVVRRRLLTAFYMFRLLVPDVLRRVPRATSTPQHIHESPPAMTVPLVVLAVLSIVGGYVGLPAGWLWGDRFGEFLAPVVRAHAARAWASTRRTEYVLMAASVARRARRHRARVRLLRSLARRLPEPSRRATAAASTTRCSTSTTIDELYERPVVGRTFWLASWLWRFVDVAPHRRHGRTGSAASSQLHSSLWRRLQTGNVQHYALTLLCVGALVIGVALLRRLSMGRRDLLTAHRLHALRSGALSSSASCRRERAGAPACGAGRSRSCRSCSSLAVLARVRSRRRRLPVRRAHAGSRASASHYLRRHRRHQLVPRAAHHVPHPLVVLAACGDVHKRVKEYMILMLVLETGMLGTLPRARPVPLLRLLGGDAGPDVPPHRRLGRPAAHLRGDQVRPLSRWSAAC